jgi:hypothetical protein
MSPSLAGIKLPEMMLSMIKLIEMKFSGINFPEINLNTIFKTLKLYSSIIKQS